LVSKVGITRDPVEYFEADAWPRGQSFNSRGARGGRKGSRFLVTAKSHHHARIKAKKKNAMEENMITTDVFDLTYSACAVFVAVFAWDRFNTPPSNRSSTRRMLYWSSCAGYILTALGLYTFLSVLLQLAPWRSFLVGGSDKALPAPLIATLAMTTLLPSLPMLKQLDKSILSFFLDWGAIPAELKRRAATMTPRTFSVAAEDVARLQDAYRDR
jgi:hypothetical protein